MPVTVTSQAVIARCPHCKAIIAAVSTSDERYLDTAAECAAQWVKEGLSIETVAAQKVREGPWCNCKVLKGVE